MEAETGPFNLTTTYLRLRNDVRIEPLLVDASFWQRIAAGELGNFHNEYLVTMYAYDKDWPMWEMHPNGDEVVCVLSGAVTFILEIEGEHRRIDLTESGSYAIVPRGTWHTASTKGVRMLFITAGEGTQHRTAAK